MWKLDKFKNNTAVITESGEKITYGELDAHCHALTDRIGKRCLVFNLCKNEIGSLAGYIGFLNAKIAAAPAAIAPSAAITFNPLAIIKRSFFEYSTLNCVQIIYSIAYLL